MSSKKIVLASNNSGKVREFNALLSPLGIEVTPQGLLGIPSCEEPYPTFVENAITKARHASKLSGLMPWLMTLAFVLMPWVVCQESCQLDSL
jgi:XTP/dITP diphosphohydrolase